MRTRALCSIIAFVVSSPVLVGGLPAFAATLEEEAVADAIKTGDKAYLSRHVDTLAARLTDDAIVMRGVVDYTYWGT
jgi:hypothetical protein